MGFDTDPMFLRDVCDLITDGSHFSPEPQAEGHPIVTAKDIPGGRIHLDTCARIRETDWVKLKRQNCAPAPGDVLLSKDGTIGRVVYYGEYLGVVILSSIAILRPSSSYNPEFLAHMLRSHLFQSQLRMLESGSALRRIILRDIKKLSFSFPRQRAEQSKIAEVLSTVDRAIEQTEALITKQQRIKIGLMQDLLTRGIDEHGNLRSESTHKFKDSPLGRIPVEWDVATVDQIALITTGDKDTQDADPAAEYPFFVRSQTVERISSYSFDGEAVLTAGDGVGTGKVFHYIIGRFDFHQRVYCMHAFSDDMYGYFFFCYFQAHFMERVAQFSAKGSVDSVRRNMIAKMLIPKPGRDEQLKIANILRSSEKTIEDHTVALEKLLHLKSGLMQDLLTGKRRVTPLLELAEVTE